MLYGIFILFLYMVIVGIAAGWFAWVVLGKSKALQRPDRKPNWAALLGLGVAGSFVGGLAMSFLSGEGFALRPSGMIASVIGALVVVAIYLWMQGRK